MTQEDVNPSTITFTWDLFLSHASEDKADVARPLANLLAAAGFRVWIDEGELVLGDSLRAKIDHGLINSRFGILILSRMFFAKKWPIAELDGLFSLEAQAEPRLLPVWHQVTVDEVRGFSPILASRVGVSTSRGLNHVRDSIVNAILKKCLGARRDQPLFRGKLTKRRLLSFPNGSIYISNSCNRDHTPVRTIELSDGVDREVIWADLRAMKETGRTCYVFRDWASYRAHMSGRMMWHTAADDYNVPTT